MDQNELLPRLFRTEYSRITAVLCRTFGIASIEVAEDIASDTFLQASENWGLKGMPENPQAWLYTVAKNKAKDYFKRQAVYKNKVLPLLKPEEVPGIDFSEENIKDSTLRMLFTLCHPCISQEAQLGLALRILCGFGLAEIASAFLTGIETINKRLTRAREKLRRENIAIQMPQQREAGQRLDTVIRALYLLFNEGYYSQSSDVPLRREMCAEAMRLAGLLAENEQTRKPEVYALLALMSFHASRFEARTGAGGAIVLYHEQDDSLWDTALVEQGEYLLNLSATGNKLSKYHLEAGIAFWHTQKEDTKEKWEAILGHYNQLLIIEYSPMAALNRTYALAKANSIEEAVREAEKLDMKDNPLYYSLLGELYRGTDNVKAAENFEKALQLIHSPAVYAVLLKKRNSL